MISNWKTRALDAESALRWIGPRKEPTDWAEIACRLEELLEENAELRVRVDELTMERDCALDHIRDLEIIVRCVTGGAA